MTQTPVKRHAKYTHLFGRNVVLNMDTSSKGEDDFRTVEGKVVDVSATALAIKHRNKIEIVPVAKIIGDVEIQSSSTKSKINVRKIKHPGGATRRHLAMRHGIALDLMNAISETVANEMHDNIDHSTLGHRHSDDGADETADGKSKRLRQRRVNDENRSIRQHMSDRHGAARNVLEALPDAMIRQLHDSTDHSNLAHRHTDAAPKKEEKHADTRDTNRDGERTNLPPVWEGGLELRI